MAKAALRSPDFNFKKAARAALMSRAEPLSAAAFNATVVGWPAPQMKTSAFAKRPMASRSIVLSSIRDGQGGRLPIAQTITSRGPRATLGLTSVDQHRACQQHSGDGRRLPV